jgi:glucose/arabinose dehydrogenase
MAWNHWLAQRRTWLGILLIALTGFMAAGCGSGGGSSASAVAAPAATVSKTIEVQAALSQAPFDGPRNLTVPPGFGIRLWARVPGARFLALAPNGDVLVSNPAAGKITLLRANGAVPQSFDFADGLLNPHDMVFRQIGGTTYLYVAESNRVTRAAYQSGDTRIGASEVIVANLPDSSTPELGGAYAHQLKNIAFSSDNKLYVAIASSCNACPEDVDSTPVRGAIYQYNADGSGGRLYARGIRNAEGLDFIPGSDRLWVTVNSRDEIGYPFDNDITGDGVSDLGRVFTSYVDENPPDLFTSVSDGANYGWPFCNALPNATMSNLDLARDAEFNRDVARLDCGSAARASKGIRAHSAPLGFSFLHGSGVPAAYRKGAVVALHGCWNCSSLRYGFKVVYFPFDDAGNAGAEVDLVSGFVIDPDARTVWGRPVDAIPDANGNILISDDMAGAIYQLYPTS